FGVGKQRESQGLLVNKTFVRTQRVARNANDLRACGLEFRQGVAEILGLGGAAWRVVFGVKVQHCHFSFQVSRAELALGGGHGKVGDRGTNLYGSHAFSCISKAATTLRPSAM